MEPGSKIKLESSGTISCLVAYSPQSGERTPAVGKRGSRQVPTPRAGGLGPIRPSPGHNKL